MTDRIGHVSNILYMFDQLKDHSYGSRAIVIAHINKSANYVLSSDSTGGLLVPTLMNMSIENLLSVVDVTRAVYVIPTNRKEAPVDTDSDSDSIEKFG